VDLLIGFGIPSILGGKYRRAKRGSARGTLLALSGGAREAVHQPHLVRTFAQLTSKLRELDLQLEISGALVTSRQNSLQTDASAGKVGRNFQLDRPTGRSSWYSLPPKPYPIWSAAN